MSDPYDPYRGGYPEPPEVTGVPSGPPTVPYPAGPPVNPYGPYGYGPEPHGPYPGNPYVPPQYAVQYSDKNKIIAGLLQLTLGFFFVLGGVGRLYAGHTAIGVIQLFASVMAWVSFGCGFLLFFPFLVTIGVWIWFILDGVVMLAGRTVDGQGRLMRG